MTTQSQDPRLLYSVHNILGFHLQDGEESELTPSGPQTLSLLMVPTSTPTSDMADAHAEEDFYLHLHLPPELDIALPATTQIYHQPPDSYLIPRWDLGPDAGAFIRIKFPGIGSEPDQVTQEDVDTFETILAQCTAFLERADPPKGYAPYNPAEYGPGEGYVSSDGRPPDSHGRIVLVDEENGSTVGELTEGYDVVEGQEVKHGSKNPVEIQLPVEGEGNAVGVNNASEEYLEMARHPAYQDSSIVQSSARASRLVVAETSRLGNILTSGAESFTQKTQPVKPVTFSDETHSRIRKVGDFSQGAAGLSAKTVGQVGKYAQNLGATLAGRKENDGQRSLDKNGKEKKPGALNRSMIAFSTLSDGIEHGARSMLTSGAAAANTMIAHRYGPEAGSVATNVTGGFKNVGLVYIDATGVSRKAVLKSAAKGMVVGRMRDGKQVLVGGGDGGEVPSGGVPGGHEPMGPSQALPPAYGAPGTRSLGGTAMPGGKR
ncbi:hypothetical protein PHISP_02740 [Aspergillus sp. HF37]|nr:hypothetical protein PHISP_02740 [Aspergillus sp. HF37]